MIIFSVLVKIDYGCSNLCCCFTWKKLFCSIYLIVTIGHRSNIFQDIWQGDHAKEVTVCHEYYWTASVYSPFNAFNRYDTFHVFVSLSWSHFMMTKTKCLFHSWPSLWLAKYSCPSSSSRRKLCKPISFLPVIYNSYA